MRRIAVAAVATVLLLSAANGASAPGSGHGPRQDATERTSAIATAPRCLTWCGMTVTGG